MQNEKNCASSEILQMLVMQESKVCVLTKESKWTKYKLVISNNIGVVVSSVLRLKKCSRQNYLFSPMVRKYTFFWIVRATEVTQAKMWNLRTAESHQEPRITHENR